MDAMPARGPLAGMPVALKDNIVTVEQPTTCASRILEGYVSPYNATVVERLRAAGAMIAAKTNLDEFAMGSSTEHSAFGRVKHPLGPKRVPGGSSGGSAALVAAGVVPAALGSETGGSVRQPASFCGVVGIKPSYGRVSRYGLVAFGSSLDCVSVFGRTVDDAARVLSTISGPDPLDATTVDRPPLQVPQSLPDLRGLTVRPSAGVLPGRPRRRSCGCAPPHHREDPGARWRGPRWSRSPIRLMRCRPTTSSRRRKRRRIWRAMTVCATASGAVGPEGDIRALYRTTRGEGFGEEVRRRILVGTYVLSAGYYDAYYKKAQQVRALIAEDFRRVFESGIDLLLTPTTPTPAFKAGEKTEDPVAMYLADVFVCPMTWPGFPR